MTIREAQTEGSLTPSGTETHNALRDFDLHSPDGSRPAAAESAAPTSRSSAGPTRDPGQPTRIDDAPVTDHITWIELAIGTGALLAWFILFLGGSLIDTTPYRSQLSGDQAGLLAWGVVGSFWTITNVGLLACCAATLGATGKRTRFTTKVVIRSEAIHVSQPLKDVFIYYASALMRGFGIYMLVFAGLLVLATETLEAPTQTKYLRLAATLSVMSFYAGYDPETFGSLFGRVRRMFENE